VAYQATLQVPPLLIFIAVADLHQQRRTLGMYWQCQAEIVMFDQTILREAPLLQEIENRR
jgi:hypothetical protein